MTKNIQKMGLDKDEFKVLYDLKAKANDLQLVVIEQMFSDESRSRSMRLRRDINEQLQGMSDFVPTKCGVCYGDGELSNGKVCAYCNGMGYDEQ